MKIMSWNINSVRLRAHLVVQAAQQLGADIICLQETKTPDEFFPHQVFQQAGYAHHHIHGMKSYNGVAILSKYPFEEITIHHRVRREDCRHIAVKVADFELHNIYIPAGGDIPDPDQNDKFAHKLEFVDELSDFFGGYQGKDPKLIPKLIALGDFNIAPLEHDVWSHKQLLDVVSHTPIEVEKLANMRASLDWLDSARVFVPPQEKLYSWWSYRNQDWRKSNRGRRLDHIWLTPPLAPRLKSYSSLVDARDWEKSSDHIPIAIEVDAE